MNTGNQTLIIIIFGVCLLASIISLTSIIITRGAIMEVLVLLMTIITSLITALATFLQGKNMSEKQAETLEAYTIQKYENGIVENDRQ